MSLTVQKGAIHVEECTADETIRITLGGDGPSLEVCHADLQDLVDCLTVIDGRKGAPSWIAAQLGVAIEEDEGVTVEQLDARPPVRFNGLFKRCPRGEICMHKALCPGSIR